MATTGNFALLGLLLSWVVSCSTGNVSTGVRQSTSGSGEIEFWTMQLQPQFTDYFKNLIATLKQKTDVKGGGCTLVSDGKQNLNCFRENGTGRREPEPNFASRLATRNAWLDLDAKIPAQLRSIYPISEGQHA